MPTDPNQSLRELTNLSPNQIRTNLRRFAQQQTEAQTRSAQRADEGTVPVSLKSSADSGISLRPSPIFPSPKQTSQTPNIPQEGNVGTAVSPYVTGSGRTTSFPTPADDTWDITAPPAGTDGVIIADDFDIFQGTAGGDTVTKSVDQTGGGSVDITSVNIYFYRRRKTYDSTGRIIAVGPQELINSIPQGSVVTLT